MSFRPTASYIDLKKRSQIINQIRGFFYQKEYLEVETPTLSRYAVTDVNLDSFETHYLNQNQKKEYYLNTSPEFHMKRLLAADYGPIFQICKAFRNGEIGRFHNPEFSILEWYKLDVSHFQLMDEIDELLDVIIGKDQSFRISYEEIFKQVLEIDPLIVNLDQLAKICLSFGFVDKSENRDELLDFLMINKIEPWIKQNHKRLYIYNYPKSQAALARLDIDNPNYSNRFELYLNGIELANGFYELADATEQMERFVADNQIRNQQQKKVLLTDENLLAALKSGLPNCSGVALGLDRLVMIALDKSSIQEVITFPFERA